MFVLPLSRLPQTLAHRTALAPQYHRAIDRLFDQSFERIVGTTPDTRSPAMDVSETDTAYTIALDVPGVTRDQLQVSVLGRRVSIQTVESTAGNTSEAPAAEAKPAPAKLLYRERGTTRFARTVSLPTEVDEASSQARVDHGVLTLTLTKKLPTGATRISVA